MTFLIHRIIIFLAASMEFGVTQISVGSQQYKNNYSYSNNGYQIQPQSVPYYHSRASSHNLMHRVESSVLTMQNNTSRYSSNLGVAYDTRFDPRASEMIAQNIMSLGYKIGTELNKKKLTGTQIFSPICVASALSLLLLGANGKTYQELMHLFGYDQNKYLLSLPFKIHEEFGFLLEDMMASNSNPYRHRQDAPWKYMKNIESHDGDLYNNANKNRINYDQHRIHIANGVFMQHGFNLRPDYINIIRSTYQSEVILLDFYNDAQRAKRYINEWVNVNTFGKIPSIITDELRPDTTVILGSALYFKALWDNPFLGSSTVLTDFYPDGPRAHSIKVNMMANGGIFPFYEGNDCNCKVIGLPYKGNLTTMYVFQPYNSTTENLRKFQEFLTPQKIEELISKMTKKNAIFALPRLHITNSFSLRDLLTNMGLQSMFSKENSDFSLLIESKKRYSQQNNDIVDKSKLLYPIQSSHSHNRNSLHNSLIFSNRFAEINESNAQNVDSIQNATKLSVLPLKNGVGLSTYSNISHHSTENSDRSKRDVSYKVESKSSNKPVLPFKSFLLDKRITKMNNLKKIYRHRRQTNDTPSESFQRLNDLLNSPELIKPPVFVEDIIHKIDLVVNEVGTEGGAAALTYLRKSGTDAVMRADTPYIILIRHDTTKLPLFFGPVYEPYD